MARASDEALMQYFVSNCCVPPAYNNTHPRNHVIVWLTWEPQ